MISPAELMMPVRERYNELVNKARGAKGKTQLPEDARLRAELNKVLGVTEAADANEAGRVQAVDNSTIDAKIKRHLRMGDMLKRKGRIASATKQIRMALDLDPNSVDVALVLTDLHLRSGQAGKALAVIARLAARKLSDKTRLLLASGRASREAGELDEAEKILLEATGLDPNSSLALFELGKLYQAKKQAAEAMKAYHRALSLIFGDEDGPETSRNSQK